MESCFASRALRCSACFLLSATFFAWVPAFGQAHEPPQEEQRCAMDEAVACSVPWLVRALTSPVEPYYEDKFEPYCVRHDGCYRHGNRTYGMTRTQCDTQFCEGMHRECDETSWSSWVTFGLSSAACHGAAALFCTAVRNAGESHYKRDDGTYCLYDRRRENAHVHEINDDGSLSSVRSRYLWSNGWTVVRSYDVQGTSYLMLLKNNTGKVHLHRPIVTGGVGERIMEYDWTGASTMTGFGPWDDGVPSHLSGGWTIAEPYQVEGVSYLFLLKSENGAVHIHRLNQDGTVGQRQSDYNWSSGWTRAKFYSVGGSTYLFLLKSETGDVHVHRMNSDGTVGTRIRSYDWSGGWTTVQPYIVDNQPYLFLLKAGNGLVHIHRINDDGSVGTLIFENDWSSGWTTAEFYKRNGRTYLFLLKKDNGTVHVHKVRADGVIGDLVQTFDWSPGWTSAQFYEVGERLYLLLVKAWRGGQ